LVANCNATLKYNSISIKVVVIAIFIFIFIIIVLSFSAPILSVKLICKVRPNDLFVVIPTLLTEYRPGDLII
jgi:hypothetical protein